MRLHQGDERCVPLGVVRLAEPALDGVDAALDEVVIGAGLGGADEVSVAEDLVVGAVVAGCSGFLEELLGGGLGLGSRCCGDADEDGGEDGGEDDESTHGGGPFSISQSMPAELVW